ncbi:MAG: peptidylprolyl isomerase [Spirochaetes bacterium]|nr:peptidylprolyl isomerase [Spirochaetota bacterium]
MKTYRYHHVILLILLVTGIPVYSWEIYDSVIAVVNDNSIIGSDVDSKFSQLLKFKNIPKSRYTFEKSRILDKFIEDTLVMQAASDEAIVVSDRRVLSHIEEAMKQHLSPKYPNEKKLNKQVGKMINRLERRLADQPMMEDKQLDKQIDGFVSFIEGRFHIGFKEYFEEIRSQIMREQVMSIAIGVSPPSKEDALDWYKKNRRKLGDEVWVKHILIRPVNNSFMAERDANKKLTNIRNKILAGESFEKLARLHSQDPESAGNGGDLGWKMLIEMEPYFAGYVNNLRSRGQVSQVFKSGMGYHIVKMMGRRPITFDNVERLIMFKLYNESMAEQFKKWVKKRKKESEIQIFMKNYIEVKA